MGPCLLVSLKQLLKELPERQQHEHIDDQVHVIAVHETVRHGPVPFAPMHDTVGTNASRSNNCRLLNAAIETIAVMKIRI